MSPVRFPVGQWPSWEAGLISMARNAGGNMGRLARLLLGRPFPGWILAAVGKETNTVAYVVLLYYILDTDGRW